MSLLDCYTGNANLVGKGEKPVINNVSVETPVKLS